MHGLVCPSILDFLCSKSRESKIPSYFSFVNVSVLWMCWSKQRISKELFLTLALKSASATDLHKCRWREIKGLNKERMDEHEICMMKGVVDLKKKINPCCCCWPNFTHFLICVFTVSAVLNC